MVMSLWSVPVDSTSEIMSRYYEIVYEDPSLDKAEVLRQAKLEFIDKHRTGGLILDWAGFVVSGEG